MYNKSRYKILYPFFLLFYDLDCISPLDHIKPTTPTPQDLHSYTDAGTTVSFIWIFTPPPIQKMTTQIEIGSYIGRD